MPDYPTRPCTCPSCSGSGSLSIPDRGALIATRTSLGISQSALARAAGWYPSVVSELESGSRPLTPSSAARYWAALHRSGGSLGWVYTYEREHPPAPGRYEVALAFTNHQDVDLADWTGTFWLRSDGSGDRYDREGLPLPYAYRQAPVPPPVRRSALANPTATHTPDRPGAPA